VIAVADAGTVTTDAGAPTADPFSYLGTPPDPATMGSLTGCPAPNTIYTEGDFGSSHPFPYAYDLSRGGTWSASGQCANLDCVNTPDPSWIQIDWETPFSSRSLEVHEPSFSNKLVAGRLYPIDPLAQVSQARIVFASGDTVDTSCSEVGWLIVDSLSSTPVSATGSSVRFNGFRARWEAHCIGGTAIKRGCVWYQDGVQPAPPPDAGTFDVSTIPTPGGVLGSPADCAADNSLHLDGDPASIQPGVRSADSSWGTAASVNPLSGPSASIQLGQFGETFFVSLDGGTPLQEGTVYEAADGGNVMRIFDTPPPFPATGEGLFQFQKLVQDPAGNYVEVQATFVEHITGTAGDVLRGCWHMTRGQPATVTAPDAGVEWLRVIPSDVGDARIDSMVAMPDGTFTGYGLTAANVDLGAGPVQLDGGTVTPFVMGIDGTGAVASVRTLSGGMSNLELAPLATDTLGDVVLGGTFPAPTLLDPAGPPVVGTGFAKLGGAGQTSWTRNFNWGSAFFPAVSVGHGGDVAVTMTTPLTEAVDFGCGAMSVSANSGAVSLLAAGDGHCLWSGPLSPNMTPMAARVAGDGSVTMVATGNGAAPLLDCVGPVGQNGPFLLVMRIDGAGHCAWARTLMAGAHVNSAGMDLTSDGDPIVSAAATVSAGAIVDLGCSPMVSALAGHTGFYSEATARMDAADGHCVWSDLLDEPTGSSGGILLGAVIVTADAQGGAMVLPRFSVPSHSATRLLHYAFDGTRTPGPELFSGPYWRSLLAGRAGNWILGGGLTGVFPVGGLYLTSGNGGFHQAPIFASVSTP
jgi:hypothetical protein